MHDPPPSVYENWPPPNYDDPITKGDLLTILLSSVAAATVVVVLARCYTRLRITNSFALDDTFICLALLPCLGLTGCSVASEQIYGWNRHIWDVSPNDIRGGLIMEFASGVLYILSSMLTKLSIIFFCRRIVTDYHPAWYRRGLDFFAILTTIGSTAYILTFCFSCQPLSAYWDFYPPNWQPNYPYHCIDIGRLWLSGSILNASWDLLTWVVPLPIVLQLELPTRQRIAVMGLFGLGLTVFAAGVMKTIYVQIAFNESYDITWVGYPSWICGALEIDIGILCASGPALRPLFSYFCSRTSAAVGRNEARRSYARMSRGRDSLNHADDATPLSPLTPAHLRIDTQMRQDPMKPWSRNRSARSSISKHDTSPISPQSTDGPLSNNSSRRLTPLTEIASKEDVMRFNQTPALLPPDEDAIQRHLDDPEKSCWSTTPKLPPLETYLHADEDFESDTTTKSPAKGKSPKKGHSNKVTPTAAEMESFNFAIPATSSRRASQATAPPSYGDFVSQNSFIVTDKDANQQDADESLHKSRGYAK